MIILKKKLSIHDRKPSSARNLWKPHNYLNTKNNTYILLTNIIIYDPDLKKEICSLPLFEDKNFDRDEVYFGYKSVAEAFVFNVDKMYYLKKKNIIKFDGEIFFNYKNGDYTLYIPKKFFTFVEQEPLVEYEDYTKILKTRYSFKITDYPDHIFKSETIDSKEILQKNKDFMEDFLKTFNFKDLPLYQITLPKLFDNFDQSIKENIISNLKNFLDKYDNFEVQK